MSATVSVHAPLWSQTSPILNYGPSLTDKEKRLSVAYNAQVILAKGGWRLPGEERWRRQGRCPASSGRGARSQVLQVPEGKAWQVRLPPSTPAPSGRQQDFSPASASRAAQSWAPARPLLQAEGVLQPPALGLRPLTQVLGSSSSLEWRPPTHPPQSPSHNHRPSPAAARPQLSAQNLLPGRS